ncbi:MAG: outer membrane beta-barrel protein [Thiogranum sp.]|jgi:hypothetical protein
MNKNEAALVLLTTLAATSARAGGLYLGASLGVMDNNVKGFDDATNAGFLVGYDVARFDVVALSVEGELTTTVSEGNVEFDGVKGNWDIDTQAAYVAARIGDTLYAKVRYGALREDVSVSAGFSQSESDSGGSWGASLGWMVTPQFGVQVDGTVVEGDVNYWNAGMVYRFQ